MPRDSAKPTPQANTATPTHAGRSHDGVEAPAPPEASPVRAEIEERKRRRTYLLSLPLPTPTRCPKAPRRRGDRGAGCARRVCRV